jgi:lipopolysaccharide transport system permease protein
MIKSVGLHRRTSWPQTQRYWELVQVLVNRQLSARYRGSVLGVYWSLLNPVMMTGLYTAIFGTTFKSYYDNSLSRYVLSVLTGLVVINFFSASTMQGLSSIVQNGGLLNKIKIPVSIFPVAAVFANVFQFTIGVAPLLMGVTLWKSGGLLNLLALPIPFLALVMVCLGVSFLVSSLFVFFRDLPYFYELVVFVLWVSSPVFYPQEIVPDVVKPLLLLNPLSTIISSMRQISLSGQLPNLSLMATALLSGVIALLIGWGCFRQWRSQFMDLL